MLEKLSHLQKVVLSATGQVAMLGQENQYHLKSVKQSRNHDRNSVALDRSVGSALATSHLTIVTDCTTLHSHAHQPSAVALADLHSEVLLPAIIAVCVAALHGGSRDDRHIAETAVTLNVSRRGYCMNESTISASWRSIRHGMVILVSDTACIWIG